MKPRMIPPPLFFAVCAILGLLLHLLHPIPIAGYSRTTGTVAAILLIVAATAIGLWALREMRRSRTPVEPWKAPVRLVTSGPFRVSRNPIYVMFIMVLIAIGIAANSIWFLAASPILLLLLDRIVITREETLLEGLFGSEYVAYKSRVRRWL